jgi:hypothetical protein
VATLDFIAKTNKVTMVGDTNLWCVQNASKVSMDASIHLNIFDAIANTVSMYAAAETMFSAECVMDITPIVKMVASGVSGNNVVGIALANKVSMVGGAERTISIDAIILLDRRMSMVASTDQYKHNSLMVTLKNINSSFGMIASAFSFVPNAALNNIIVLNLRTKAHSTYLDGDLDAYATTGSLNFGSAKNNNVSDAFLLGRSTDSLEIDVWNDEETKRTYSVDFRNNDVAKLQNKKQPLAKGLTGTNWKFGFKNTNHSYAEVRNVDLFVGELRRHT